MGRKLFLTDLDGTLLNSRKQVTPRTYEALQRFAAEGNVFGICTGRSTENAVSVQKQLRLDFPGSMIVAFNGAEIYDPGNSLTIYRTGIPLAMTADILALAGKRCIHVHTYNDRYIVSSAYDEQMIYYKKAIKSPVIVTDDVLSELDRPPCKIIGIELEDLGRLEAFRQEILQLYGDTLSSIYSNANYLEIFPKEAGKGAALERLCRHLNIPVENSMAAGDAENDISMVKAAGCGIAMCNGSSEIREAADVVTENDNDHDGLVPFLS